MIGDSMTSVCSIGGRPIPTSMLAAPRSLDARSATPAAIQAALAEDGLAVLRTAIGRGTVLEARREVLLRLAEMGEIAEPLDEAIATGTSRRLERAPDADAFWRGVCEGPALRRAAHGPALRALATAALGRPAKPFDFLWLRTMVEGRASPLHFDHVYMNRGSASVLTAWVPLGDVPLSAGPIVFVEGSHRFEDVIARYRGVDVDRDGLPGSFPDDAIAFAHARGCRLLTTDFAAGDIVLFGMFTLHGSCDNRQGGGRVRLSCDVRWQPEGEAEDDRWFGSPPTGHEGKSYGGMNGARPLGEAYIAR